jgi:hypothetical protein
VRRASLLEEIAKLEQVSDDAADDVDDEDLDVLNPEVDP